MPLVGIDCPKHGQLSFEEAVTGKCDCTPRFLLDSIINVAQRDYHKGNLISPTSLLGCLRETYLTREYNYFATVSQLYYSWRGTLIHSVLNRPKLKNWVSEKTYKKTLALNKKKAVTIKGTIDGYDELTFTLWDIKTIGDRGLNFIIKDGAKKEHVEQLNIYRWLCPFVIKRMRSIYITMMSFIQTGQINEVIEKYKNPPDQKKKGIVYYKQISKNPSGYNDYILYYDTPEVSTWGKQETVDFMRPRAIILNKAFEKKIVPPMCDKETQVWKCKRYCKVNTLCQEYEKKEKKK